MGNYEKLQENAKKWKNMNFLKIFFFRIFDIKMGLSFLEYKYHIISEISLIQRQITYYSLR